MVVGWQSSKTEAGEKDKKDGNSISEKHPYPKTNQNTKKKTMAHILVVDDSEITRNDVANFLIEHDYDVITAANGEEGVLKIQEHPEVQLVISDISMPVMDGITMIEKIRLELNNNKVRIFVFTNENDPAMKARCKELKVIGWLIKPFNGPGALATIRRLVKL